MSESGDDEPRHLINTDGSSLSSDLPNLRRILGRLRNPARKAFRDSNASFIATHSARRILVVAGPGAGKSFLFMQRISHWLSVHEGKRVYVSSFVRKLVVDLRTDVLKLPEEEQERVSVSTLHGLALAILNKGRGTGDQPLSPPVQVISAAWDDMVWNDVLAFHGDLSRRTYTKSAFARQLYEDEVDASEDWPLVRTTYFTLTQFYNAVGFADLIHHAYRAIEERPSLIEHSLWIVDEFQDFNLAEDRLIRALTDTASGVLIAGDDEQALYQQLKSSAPDIITGYYGDTEFANAMLPYCSRCSYHVCLAASHFISQDQEAGAIEKIYLPLKVDEGAPKVQIVATNTPSGAVDYIQKFLADHKNELESYIDDMKTGDEKDPFLLILTPDKKVKFLRLNGADRTLRDFVSRWAPVDIGHSPDYRKFATFQRVGRDLTDNFALRKVLDYLGTTVDKVHELLVGALEIGSLAEVSSSTIDNAVGVCIAVTSVLDSDALSPREMVDRLSDLVSISDKGNLVDELANDPLGHAPFEPESEAEEVIETAGALAPVELMSIVGSKGLSAQHVIILGCDDVNLAKTSRLAFFVGLTRARKSLHLLTSLKAGGSNAIHPFVLALPESNCDFVVYRKTDHASEVQANRTALVRRVGTWANAGQRSRGT